MYLQNTNSMVLPVYIFACNEIFDVRDIHLLNLAHLSRTPDAIVNCALKKGKNNINNSKLLNFFKLLSVNFS